VDMLHVALQATHIELWWKGEKTPRIINRN
jgi:hypothetical protein